MRFVSRVHLIAKRGRIGLSLTMILGLVTAQMVQAADMTTGAQTSVSQNHNSIVNIAPSLSASSQFVAAEKSIGHSSQVNSIVNRDQMIGQSPPLAPLAVAITATKRAALLVDVDGDTRADPGDALRYTVIIRNSGDTNAAGVTFNDTLDNNTTLSGTVRSSPLAVAESYSVFGNIPITITAPGVLSNDYLGSPSATLTPIVNGTTTQGGNITLNANGGFTYNPPPGYEGTDTFTYTLSNSLGSDVGTVTFTISGMAWFIDSGFSGTSDGRFTNPFKTISAFQAVNNGSGNNPAANDTIFIYESGSAYSPAAITLLAGQRLLGEGVSLGTELGALPTGSPSMPGASTAPTLNNSATIITLGSNNTLKGLILAPSAGSGIAGSGSLGATTVSTVTINLSGSANGVNLSNHTGTFNYTSSSISGTSSGTGVTLDSNNGSATIAATISSSSGRPVNVTNKTGGTVTFSGAVSGTGQGVFLNNNSGATITFSGGVSLNTGANAAFTATGGGAINVCDKNPCGAGSSVVNTLATTTGTALNVANTTIGSSGLTFRSISSNGAVDGIVLNNTGSSGGLTVLGTGTPGSGGTIQNSTDSGILGTSTSNLNLSYMNILNNGNALNEGGIRLVNVFGTGSINSSTVSGGYEDNVFLQNTSGTLTGFTIQGPNCSITNNNSSQGNTGVTVLAASTANMTVAVNNCQFSGNRTDAIHTDAGDSATLNSTISNNTITAGSPNQGNIGIEVTAATSASVIYDVNNNKVGTNGVSNLPLINTGINVFNGGTTSSMSGKVRNNTVVNAGTGSGFGMRVFNSGNSSLNANVANNTVSNVALDYGILVESSGGTVAGQGVMQVAVTGNDSSVLSGALDAIRLQARNTNTICARVSSNTTIHPNDSDCGNTTFCGLYVRQANTAVFNLEGLALGSQTAATTRSFLISQNPSADTVGAIAATNFTGVAANSCTSIPTSIMQQPGDTVVVPARNNVGVTAAAPVEAAPGESDSQPASSNHVVEPAQIVRPITQLDRVDTNLSAPLGPIAPLNIGALPAGKTMTITFDVTINNPVPPGVTQVSNQSQVSGSNFSTVLTDDPDTAAPNDPTVTPLDIPVDLRVSKSVNPVTAYPGRPITYTIAYLNAGPLASANVVITDQIPNALTGVSYQSSRVITPTGLFSYVWQVGTLTSGQGGVITITGIISPAQLVPTTITNTATITGTGRDTNSSNNSANAVLPVTDRPITGLSATNDSPTLLGSSTTFTATATGSNITYQWNFGDGASASGASTTHMYAAAGAYTAIVTATNSVGPVTATTHVLIFTSRVYLPLVMRN